MRVKDLRQLLKGMPSNMKVVIGANGSLEDICIGSAGVIQVKFDDSDEKELLFVLPECTCKLQETEIQNENINCKPELN